MSIINITIVFNTQQVRDFLHTNTYSKTQGYDIYITQYYTNLYEIHGIDFKT